jgi:hypothetical protein
VRMTHRHPPLDEQPDKIVVPFLERIAFTTSPLRSARNLTER